MIELAKYFVQFLLCSVFVFNLSSQSFKESCAKPGTHTESSSSKFTAPGSLSPCTFLYRINTSGVCDKVRLRPSTVKASSVWSWNSREQINNLLLKMFLSSAKSLHRYLSMKDRAFLYSPSF